VGSGYWRRYGWGGRRHSHRTRGHRGGRLGRGCHWRLFRYIDMWIRDILTWLVLVVIVTLVSRWTGSHDWKEAVQVGLIGPSVALIWIRLLRNKHKLEK
jgi:hypothetical protein